MTNEEAIKELQSMCDHLHAHGICDKDSKMLTACKMAISALEQMPEVTSTMQTGQFDYVRQPCDDAISRDAALEKMADYVASGYADSAEDFEEYSRIICQLPSVTQKSGKWIKRTDRLPEDKTYVLTTIKVPNRVAHARSGWYDCGFFHNDNGDMWRATDMEVKAWMPLPEPYEPQERSDKG